MKRFFRFFIVMVPQKVEEFPLAGGMRRGGKHDVGRQTDGMNICRRPFVAENAGAVRWSGYGLFMTEGERCPVGWRTLTLLTEYRCRFENAFKRKAKSVFLQNRKCACSVCLEAYC